MAHKKLSGDVYYPSEATIARARVKDWDSLIAEAETNPEAFWAREAKELHWFEPWTAILDDSKKPFFCNAPVSVSEGGHLHGRGKTCRTQRRGLSRH